MAEHFNDYGIPHRNDRQAVLNQSWPPSEVAARLKDRVDGIDVRVRVVLERDGETWVDGVARRWYGQHVCVEHGEPRMWTRYVWVDASDLRRR